MSNDLTRTTPPESFVNLPLTPPSSDGKSSKHSRQVSLIAKHLHLRQTGSQYFTQPWIIIPLLFKDFEQLLEAIEVDQALWGYVRDKIRYDYFWRNSQFVLRMPTNTHEVFGASVVDEIQTQLKRIGAGTTEEPEFTKVIKHLGSPRLHFPADEASDEEVIDDGKEEEREHLSKYNVHEPDAAFGLYDAQWPGVVIEVSYSQKSKMLKDLAEDYILGSNGNIRVVVGLEIEYRQSKKATLSIWRPQYVEHEDGQQDLVSTETVWSQVTYSPCPRLRFADELIQEFRNELGTMPEDTANTGLELQLQDFASEALTEYSQFTAQRVFISSNTLYSFLTRAQNYEKQIKEMKGTMSPLRPGARKRPRQKTPPDELKSDDERRFLKHEEQAAKKMVKRDGDYS